MTSIDVIGSSSQATAGMNSSFQAQRQKVMQSAADLLKMTPSDLQTQLQSGKSLSDIAASQGVSEDTLKSTITDALKANAPAGAAANVDFTQMAQNIATHKGGGHHHGGAQGAASDSTSQLQSLLSPTGDNQATSTLQTLASALGVDSSTLLQQLQGDPGLSQLLGSSSTTDGSSMSNNDPLLSDPSSSSTATSLQTLIGQLGTKGLQYDGQL